MKKTVALLLALSMVFLLCACGESQISTPTPKPSPKNTPIPTPTPEPTPYLSETSVKSAAKDYVKKNGPSRFAEKAGSSSVGNITIGEVSCDDWKKIRAGGSVFFHLDVTVNGSFYTIDKYGNYGKKYNFTWWLSFNDHGYHTSDTDSLSVFKQ